MYVADLHNSIIQIIISSIYIQFSINNTLTEICNQKQERKPRATTNNCKFKEYTIQKMASGISLVITGLALIIGICYFLHNIMNDGMEQRSNDNDDSRELSININGRSTVFEFGTDDYFAIGPCSDNEFDHLWTDSTDNSVKMFSATTRNEQHVFKIDVLKTYGNAMADVKLKLFGDDEYLHYETGSPVSVDSRSSMLKIWTDPDTDNCWQISPERNHLAMVSDSTHKLDVVSFAAANNLGAQRPTHFKFHKVYPFLFETGDLVEFKPCGMEGHFWKGDHLTISKQDGDNSAHLFIIEKKINTDDGVVMVSFKAINDDTYFNRYSYSITLRTEQDATPMEFKPTLALNGDETCWSFSDNSNEYNPLNIYNKLREDSVKKDAVREERDRIALEKEREKREEKDAKKRAKKKLKEERDKRRDRIREGTVDYEEEYDEEDSDDDDDDELGDYDSKEELTKAMARDFVKKKKKEKKEGKKNEKV